LQQVGGAVGVALIGTLFFGQLSHNAYASFDAGATQLRSQLTAEHVPAAVQDAIVSGSRTCFYDRSTEKDSSVVPASCAQASQPGSSAIGTAIENSALNANERNFASAFRAGVIYELGLLTLVFILSFLLPKKFKMQEG
jgi:hypothetical protein